MHACVGLRMPLAQERAMQLSRLLRTSGPREPLLRRAWLRGVTAFVAGAATAVSAGRVWQWSSHRRDVAAAVERLHAPETEDDRRAAVDKCFDRDVLALADSLERRCRVGSPYWAVMTGPDVLIKVATAVAAARALSGDASVTVQPRGGGGFPLECAIVDRLLPGTGLSGVEKVALLNDVLSTARVAASRPTVVVDLTAAGEFGTPLETVTAAVRRLSGDYGVRFILVTSNALQCDRCFDTHWYREQSLDASVATMREAWRRHREMLTTAGHTGAVPDLFDEAKARRAARFVRRDLETLTELATDPDFGVEWATTDFEGAKESVAEALAATCPTKQREFLRALGAETLRADDLATDKVCGGRFGAPKGASRTTPAAALAAFDTWWVRTNLAQAARHADQYFDYQLVPVCDSVALALEAIGRSVL